MSASAGTPKPTPSRSRSSTTRRARRTKRMSRATRHSKPSSTRSRSSPAQPDVPPAGPASPACTPTSRRSSSRPHTTKAGAPAVYRGSNCAAVERKRSARSARAGSAARGLEHDEAALVDEILLLAGLRLDRLRHRPGDHLCLGLHAVIAGELLERLRRAGGGSLLVLGCVLLARNCLLGGADVLVATAASASAAAAAARDEDEDERDRKECQRCLHRLRFAFPHQAHCDAEVA